MICTISFLFTNSATRTHLFGGDRLLGCLCQFFDRLGIVSQIALAADEDDWETLAEVKDLRDPLSIVISPVKVCEDAGLYTFS
jgi:hypothetical protein